MYDLEKIQEISDNIDKVVKDHFDDSFSFRPNQKEICIGILYNWLYGKSSNILSAPTGSGKSIIALICAGTLVYCYNKRGYILISDLSLIDQYEKDIDVHFPEWTVIKGQANYKCNMNGMPFPSGVCKLAGCKAYSDIYAKYPDCVGDCEYIQKRDAAVKSDLLVCTYHFWLLQQNIVKHKVPEPPFTERDFVICDEAHKILDIMQGNFSPCISLKDCEKINIMLKVCPEMPTDLIDEYKRLTKELYSEESNERILELLSDYTKNLSDLCKAADSEKKTLKLYKKTALTKDQKAFLAYCNKLQDSVLQFNDYVEFIRSTSCDDIIKNDGSGDQKVVFNCINEYYLMQDHFHDNCERSLFMSATLGNNDVYASSIGLDESDYAQFSVPNTFDFSWSPIYIVNERSMGTRHKEESFPYVKEMIRDIMKLYEGKRGIIQTGSYKFAKSLYEALPAEERKRLILYEDTASKFEAIEEFNVRQDAVLVGPSLVEGLSFNDDLCRFLIIMKVPYPYLGDKLVKAKFERSAQWYMDTTAVSILQGVGRGVRHAKDWCTTFIIDSDFVSLLARSSRMFPRYITDRMQYISSSSLKQQ